MPLSYLSSVLERTTVPGASRRGGEASPRTSDTGSSMSPLPLFGVNSDYDDAAGQTPYDYLVVVTSAAEPVSSFLSYGDVLRHDLSATVASAPSLEMTGTDGVVSAVLSPGEVFSLDIPRADPAGVSPSVVVVHVTREGVERAAEFMRGVEGVRRVVGEALVRVHKHAKNEAARRRLLSSVEAGSSEEHPSSVGFVVSDLRLTNETFCSAQLMAACVQSVALDYTFSLVDRKFSGHQREQIRTAFRGLEHRFYRAPMNFGRVEVVIPRDQTSELMSPPPPSAGDAELARLFHLYGAGSPAVLQRAAALGIGTDADSIAARVMLIECSGPHAYRMEQVATEMSRAVARERSRNQARWLVDFRASEFRPSTVETFLGNVFAGADPSRLTYRVYSGQSTLVALFGARLLYDVGRGAGGDVGSSLAVVEYAGAGDPARPWVVLAGKGITFDAGGLNIKGTPSMNNMHFDKAGAVACLAAVAGAYALGLGINVAAVLPFAENTVGPDAYHPGDVVTSMSGLTVDVDNTDAEGRLILADAISFARYRYTVGKLITVATLTGAVHAALGSAYTAIYGNSEQFIAAAVWASRVVGEPVWRMPLSVAYRTTLRALGNASVVNSAAPGVGAGSCTAAEFLRIFVEVTMPPHAKAAAAFGDSSHAMRAVSDVPSWVHLDIASTAMENAESRTPSGNPTRLLIYMLEQCAAQSGAGGAGSKNN